MGFPYIVPLKARRQQPERYGTQRPGVPVLQDSLERYARDDDDDLLRRVLRVLNELDWVQWVKSKMAAEHGGPGSVPAAQPGARPMHGPPLEGYSKAQHAAALERCKRQAQKGEKPDYMGELEAVAAETQRYGRGSAPLDEDQIHQRAMQLCKRRLARGEKVRYLDVVADVRAGAA
jgi:hypothetical protein